MCEFTTEELQRVFKILTGKDGIFDKDKLCIINCNHTADIKACPGSGKTTTLLAKLVLLADKMPLDNGKGICVLTYTNVAIDEIKSKLGHKADVLFTYPNYFGTMQAFVDEFFASAALQYYYGARIAMVDDDRANEELYKVYSARNFSDNCLRKFLYQLIKEKEAVLSRQDVELCGGEEVLLKLGVVKYKNQKKKQILLNCSKKNVCYLPSSLSGKNKRNIFDIVSRISNSVQNKTHVVFEETVKSVKVNFVGKKLESIGGKDISFSTKTGKEFVEIKEQQLRSGNLKFYDSFNLALRLLNEFPNLKEELSERFEYLFVDEMQDTRDTELSFLNQAFDKNKINIQYFGDVDQAIFQDEMKNDSLWKPKNPLLLNSSKRFGNEIALVVNPFRLDSSESIKGNENVYSLKPIMLVYGDSRKVLPTFVDLLEQNTININGKSYSVKEYSLLLRDKDPLHRINVKAVGWSGTNNQDGKIKISSYFPEYQRNQKSSVEKTQNLYELLQHRIDTYQDAVKLLYEIFLDFLRFSGIKSPDNRYFTKTSLLSEIDKNEDLKDRFKCTLANCTTDLMENKKNDCAIKIANFLEKEFIAIFQYNQGNVSDFCAYQKQVEQQSSMSDVDNVNIYRKSGIDIEVGTVHSVKGETHVATLYMETFYRTGYESTLLWNQFLGQSYVGRKGDSVIKEALKIAYVAMSRPRYMLCFAVSNEHYQESDEIRKRWNVIKI